MGNLSLDRKNYEYHMSQIYKEDKKHLRNTTNNIIKHELLTAKACLERSIEVMESISRDSNNTALDRISVEKIKHEISINIIRLIKDEPQGTFYQLW